MKLSIKIPACALLLLLLSCSKSVSQSKIPNMFYGQYTATVKTEQTTSGMASVTYNFSVLKDKVLLNTNTWQEPVRCNGTYKAIAKDNILMLYYTGKEANCADSSGFSFSVKKENGKLYVKGLGSEATNATWVELKEVL